MGIKFGENGLPALPLGGASVLEEVKLERHKTETLVALDLIMDSLTMGSYAEFQSQVESWHAGAIGAKPPKKIVDDVLDEVKMRHEAMQALDPNWTFAAKNTADKTLLNLMQDDLQAYGDYLRSDLSIYGRRPSIQLQNWKAELENLPPDADAKRDAILHDMGVLVGQASAFQAWTPHARSSPPNPYAPKSTLGFATLKDVEKTSHNPAQEGNKGTRVKDAVAAINKERQNRLWRVKAVDDLGCAARDVMGSNLLRVFMGDAAAKNSYKIEPGGQIKVASRYLEDFTPILKLFSRPQTDAIYKAEFAANPQEAYRAKALRLFLGDLDDHYQNKGYKKDGKPVAIDFDRAFHLFKPHS